MRHGKWYLWICLVMAAGCGPRKMQPAPAQLISGSEGDASCPCITYTPDGKLALSWVETRPGKETGRICYALYDEQSRAFAPPQEIATTEGVLPHAENMPKLAFKPGGEMIAMFGAEQHDARNKYAGQVFYTQSFDKGRTWQPARPLVQDTASYDQRYFDMACLPDGEAAAIWLDNRRETQLEGSTLYYAATSGRSGFTGERPLARTICQCCRTDLYVEAGGGIHAAFRDIINDSIRDMVHMVSGDGGRSFSGPVRISADNWVIRGCPHTGPAMVKNRYGLHFAWFTMGNGAGVFYCRSGDNGKTYTKKEAVSTAPMAKHPQITALGNEDVLLVWDEPVKAGNVFNSRIGITHKAGDGSTLETALLTPDTQYAVFPVAGALGRDRALIAYTKKAGERHQVWYQVVGF